MRRAKHCQVFSRLERCRNPSVKRPFSENRSHESPRQRRSPIIFLTRIYLLISEYHVYKMNEKLNEMKNYVINPIVMRVRILMMKKKQRFTEINKENAQENTCWRKVSRKILPFTLIKGETRKGLGFSSVVDILLTDKDVIASARERVSIKRARNLRMPFGEYLSLEYDNNMNFMYCF